MSQKPETITRFALTHVNKDGMRTLTRRNIGASHWDRRDDADAYLAVFLVNNTESTLDSVFGVQARGTYEIRPVECYPHGDAVRIYFDP